MKNLLKIFVILCFVQFANSQNKPNKKYGVCFAMYTVHENILKMTAQFYPIKNYDPFRASLQIERNGKWETVQESEILYPGYTAHFRIEDWDDKVERAYRIFYHKNANYQGMIRKNPMDQKEIVMAAFSCWSTYQKHGGAGAKDITDNLKKLNPDVLFFAGDQVYDHSNHYGNWLKFGEVFGEIIKNTPTITIPDDHDIGQGNLWGDGGRKSDNRDGNEGGYYMPVSYIQEVERAQTSHLPDPYDPTPIERGVGVYYTDLNWGGVSFAILEDRKFKSGPKRVLDKKRYSNTLEMDVEGATLLGNRQLQFLEDWTTDWENAQMKAVLSQTIFTNLATHTPTIDKKMKYSVDSNGWPQTGRNKALKVIRKSFSCMIAGDQHLGSVVKHGVENWNDSGYSFAVPAAANFWMRWWNPDKPGKNKESSAPNYTGEYEDAFHNKITVHAVANPTHRDNEPRVDLLDGRAAGYGIIKFNKLDRKVTFECWKRNIDITDPKSKQYNGWPVTFGQADNFQIKDGYQLPKFKISKKNQVVTVKDAYTKEVKLSLRINGTEYQPTVNQNGIYVVEIGEGDSLQRFYNIESQKRNRASIVVKI